MKSEFWRRANREAADGTAPLFLRITICQQRAEIASGIDVPAAYWNVATHRIEVPGNKNLRLAAWSAEHVLKLNAQLTKLKAAAGLAYDQLRLSGPPTARHIRERVRGVRSPAAAPLTVARASADFLAAMAGPGIGKSPNTLSSYRSRLGNVAEFFARGLQQKAFDLQDVRLPTARALERWCLAQRAPDGRPRFGHAAMAKQINMLQMLVAWAAIEGHVPANALHGYKYQSTATPALPRFLPGPEQALLAATVFHSTPLNDVADMWLFSAHTALSFVDYCRFAADPLPYLHTDAQGREWIRMTRQKMAKRKPQGFSVPFFPEARAIFERRRGRLPVKNNKDVNAYLKIIAAELSLGLPDLTFKDSRSSFAQRWRDLGATGAVIAAMMGDEERVVNKNYSQVREAAITVELARLAEGPALRTTV
ncbi:hypothetical protein [Hymenobacter nivis]|nr:hypothetical protein [Hymenobacter nivis]